MSATLVAEEWRLQSIRDLEVANQLASSQYFEWAAYAAQQAAEKAIKAVRHALAIDTRADVKLSHRLIDLANPIAEAYATLLPSNADLGTITQHEADGRYPSVRTGSYLAPFKIYNQATADKALLIAREVVERCSRLTQDLQAFWSTRPATPGTTAPATPVTSTPGAAKPLTTTLAKPTANAKPPKQHTAKPPRRRATKPSP